MFVWNGDPIAFSLGPVAVHYYGLFFASGFVLGYIIMQFLFKKAGYKTEDLDKLLTFIFIGTVLGARLGHCLIYEPEFYLSHPIEILKIWRGGLASHGGTLGVLLAIYLFVKRYHYKFLIIADMLCIPVALVSTFIRLGNFMNSEILGKYTDSPLGIVFARVGDTMPRYPAQLFEAVAYFAIFIILALAYFLIKKRAPGFILGLLFILVFTARFLIEPLKVEQADYSTGIALNVGQLLSIPFIILGIGLIIYSQKQLHRLKR